jgi:hypothetical protein
MRIAQLQEPSLMAAGALLCLGVLAPASGEETKRNNAERERIMGYSYRFHVTEEVFEESGGRALYRERVGRVDAQPGLRELECEAIYEEPTPERLMRSRAVLSENSFVFQNVPELTLHRHTKPADGWGDESAAALFMYAHAPDPIRYAVSFQTVRPSMPPVPIAAGTELITEHNGATITTTLEPSSGLLLSETVTHPTVGLAYKAEVSYSPTADGAFPEKIVIEHYSPTPGGANRLHLRSTFHLHSPRLSADSSGEPLSPETLLAQGMEARGRHATVFEYPAGQPGEPVRSALRTSKKGAAK